MAMVTAIVGWPHWAVSQEIRVTLSGNQEIPPVTTSASGSGFVVVKPDRSITGSITVTGMAVTVAHIHEGSAGTNGPIIILLTRTSDTVWSVPPDTRLSEVQHRSFEAGNLYYNVHSATFRSGEIRGQIRPGASAAAR
jgi:CHRD domain